MANVQGRRRIIMRWERRGAEYWVRVNQNIDGSANELQQKIYNNDPTQTMLLIDKDRGYFPKNGDGGDWRDLGNAIGNNNYLRELKMCISIDNEDDLEAFFRGMANNRSIHRLCFDRGHLYGGRVFTLLLPFFRSNRSLHSLILQGQPGEHLDANGIRILTSVLEKFSSLISFDSTVNARAIIPALSGHTELRKLSLGGVDIGSEGCADLGGLLEYHLSSLETLSLRHAGLDNESMNILAPALAGWAGNDKLRTLDLSHNPGIDARGWSVILSNLFQGLSTLTVRVLNHLNHNTITGGVVFELWKSSKRYLADMFLTLRGTNNETAALLLADSLADSLANNRTLNKLKLDLRDSRITETGWKSFLNLVCNKSSIEETYHSNHTLEKIVSVVTDALQTLQTPIPPTLKHCLRLNKENNTTDAARLKILECHFSGKKSIKPIFDMGLKVWPHAYSWMAKDDAGFSLLYRVVRGTIGAVEGGEFGLFSQQTQVAAPPNTARRSPLAPRVSAMQRFIAHYATSE